MHHYNLHVQSDSTQLPCPPLTIELPIPAETCAEIDFLSLPALPGVFVFEDENGGVLALAVTANLRRLVRARLDPPSSSPEVENPSSQEPNADTADTVVNHDPPSSRRIDYRKLTRIVRAGTVGSSFEAEWLYLQYARRLLPTTYASLLDRWRTWFVHVNPEADHPRWTKTPRPFAAPTGETGCYFGPIADKHAAARYIETIEDAFDLCRYHHILVQSPDASACAYKEMGRCPAPCDGSISLDDYREMIRQAADFAATPIASWRAARDDDMIRAGEQLDFEAAARFKSLLARTKPCTRAEFVHVRRVEEARFLGVYPSENKEWARLFLVLGGGIIPFVDVPCDLKGDGLQEVIEAIRFRTDAQSSALRGTALEHLGLIGRHLFRPKNNRSPGELIHLDEALEAAQLRRALRRLSKRAAGIDEIESMPDQILDSPSAEA